jgi:DNA-binding MurR/RpiR family transcriptional regulator
MDEPTIAYHERIRSMRPSFSPSFNRLADYLLDSYPEAAFLTATELAHSLDLDAATVVRFAQKLGYPGYPDLQREIRQRVRDKLLVPAQVEAGSEAEAAAVALRELQQALEMTRRSFSFEAAHALITALDESERVILLAEGAAQGPARSLAGWLESAGYSVHLANGSVSDLARALAGARRGDLAMAIEVDGESPFLTRALNGAQHLGVRTAALVTAPSSPAARHADIVLAAQASPHPAAGQVLIEALIYALVHMLIRARPGRFGQVTQRIEQLTSRLIQPES